MDPRSTYRKNTGRRRSRGVLPFVACAALAAAGCDEPPIDSNSPPPAGVMEGTVLYVGPRPTCDYDDNGVPVRAHGRVVLTLFEFDNPPPPNGSATSALNLLAIPGNAVFSNLPLSCPPAGTPVDPSESITSSVAFTWPELPLGIDRGVKYLVRGFYDHDESFNPFFNITQSPTAGDIAGAAVDDPTSDSPQVVGIEFGTEAEFPLGQLVGSVSVSLGIPVRTDPPVFFATSDPLPSSTGMTINTNVTLSEAEAESLALTNTTLHLYESLADGPGTELAEALDAAGLDFEIGQSSAAYGWYVRSIDLDGNMMPDDHPVLFHPTFAPYKYFFPLVILERRQTDLEIASGIPSVIMATVLPQFSGVAVTDGEVISPDLPIIVPPIGVAITNPALGDVCRIPFFAPNTLSLLYLDDEGGPRLADCQELPTGRYELNALNGLAGGEVVVDMATSDTGFNIVGGQYASQTWTAPNALGDPAQLADPGTPPDQIPADCTTSPCAVEQSVANAFLIYDDTPDVYDSRRADTAGCQTTIDPVSGSADVPDPEWDETGINAFVASDPTDAFNTPEDVQAACCDPIAHLCEVPLCPAVPDVADPGLMVRGTPTSVSEIVWNGERRQRPNCVPFHMPFACCTNVPPEL